MAITVQERKGWLVYRVYVNGLESRESTGLRATRRNLERVEKKARLLSELMAEGAFDYLTHFPDGNLAAHFKPAESPPPPRPLTIREYALGMPEFQGWLPRSHPPLVRATLAKTRAKHLRCHILPALGDIALPEVSPRQLEEFRSLLTRPTEDGGKGLKVKTARDIIDSTLRALYRDARLIDYTVAFGSDTHQTVDPFVALKWKREVLPEPDPFTEDERDRVLAHFWARKRHGFSFIFTLFHTGMRLGEAVGLRWGKVDVRARALTIAVSRTLSEDNSTKTANATRTISLALEVAAVLREAQPLRATEQDFVFTTESGGALDADRFVERHWRPALRACGLKLRPLKATRHTFISVALSRGSKPRWVAKYCGTSLDMLDRHYSRWMDGDDAELAQLQIARPSPLEAVG